MLEKMKAARAAGQLAKEAKADVAKTTVAAIADALPDDSEAALGADAAADAA